MRKSFFHPMAIVESKNIGDATRVWAFSHVQEHVVIGRNCNIGEQCFIENEVMVGNNVVIKNGVALWAGIIIEDGVFVGPNVSFTNLTIPRAGIFPEEWEKTLIRKGASIGANATILCGLTLGRFSLVGAGSVVTHDVPDFAIVVGNPSHFRGWICKCGKHLTFKGSANEFTRCDCGYAYAKKDGLVVEDAE